MVDLHVKPGATLHYDAHTYIIIVKVQLKKLQEMKANRIIRKEKSTHGVYR